jgi:UDP-glucose 4-epimerase
VSARSIVLGHSGFIGRPLFSELNARGLDAQGFSSRELNLRDSNALNVLDALMSPETTLFVCAALTPDRGATLDTCVDHISMTANLARYLAQHDLRKCIFVSSDAVYPMVDEPVDETTRVAPEGAYPVAKYTSERLMEMGLKGRGTPLLIVRPTGVFGPGDTHNSYGPNRFVRTSIADHSVRLFGEGEETRDHIFVQDLVRILADLADADVTGILNIATGTSRSFGSVVEALRALASFEVVNAPRSGPITHRTFNVAGLRSALPNLWFTPFEEALRLTYEAAAAPARA